MLEFWQDDGQSVNDIAARLSLPGHALSPLLALMDRAGLLTRTRQAPNRRVVWVRLTPAGHDREDVVLLDLKLSARCATHTGRSSSPSPPNTSPKDTAPTDTP